METNINSETTSTILVDSFSLFETDSILDKIPILSLVSLFFIIVILLCKRN